MNKIKYATTILILLFLIQPPLAAFVDPGVRDTLRIDSVSAFPGGQAVLPVYFVNDELLSAVEFVFRYDENFLTIDSFSLIDTRLDYIDLDNVQYRDSADLINLLVPDFADYIPTGSGRLCYLYFSVAGSAAGQNLVIDTANWPLLGGVHIYSSFSDQEAQTIRPIFVSGMISVLDAPPTNDSAWVDSIGAIAGDQAVVNVYGYNEDDLSLIDLSLTYSSPNLLYSGITFDGTRGLSAQQTIEVNETNRQIHIALDYGELAPLIPGRGPLATITFEVFPGSPEELVVIDSGSYLGIQPLTFHQTTAAGGVSYAPFFLAGYVDIKAPTDIVEIESEILPDEYALAQNHPNPFNPATSISFDLPTASYVSLEVYNILGRHVRNLVNEELAAGRYTVNFDGCSDRGEELASGLYLYKIKAGDFTGSKKMMMLK